VAQTIVFPHDYVILDACYVINLRESDSMSAILESLQVSVAIADIVFQEEILLGKHDGELRVQALVDNGLLAIVNFESEDEMNAFINFAAVMDDGEAATSAIAVSRDWVIATDDRKAIQFLRQNVAEVRIVTTLELLKHWVDTVHPPADTVRTVLENIRSRAHYIPHTRHHLYGWWATCIKG
jgi:predicted nucleic acid-binding protein